ncbi:MAG TPA: hypothetical protein VJR92_11235 [Gemmatimonadaceae bacterium]|nr:hypothetical protein [Gemmatimonadaceae bacterium]
MPRPESLHPFDVVLAIRLARPAGTLAQLGEELAVVASRVHASLVRLQAAGLVRPGTRETNRLALIEFLEHGVRYAFPGAIGREALGIPTAHSAEILASEIDASDALVWPATDADSPVRGYSIAPLYPGATQLPRTSPETYRIVALVDALRVGGSRERALAAKHIRNALQNLAAA